MAYTQFCYHIVFATKNRKRWIDEEIEEFLYPVMCRQFKLRDGRVLAIGGIEDHVHVAADIEPTVAVTDVVKHVKRDTSRAIRRNFKRRRAFKWQVSFSGFTVCPYDMQDLLDYIHDQKEHHQNETLREEFEFMLEECSKKGADDAKAS